MSAWQPIESAPMNGTRIDVFSWSGERTTDVWWEDTKLDWLFWGYDGFGMGCIRIDQALTHWMPKPAPPEAT